MIEIEELELAQYEDEKLVLDDQITEFERWFQDKIKIQENTLDRVIEQFSFKASIKETLINGENKRASLINFQAPPRSENYYLNKLKNRQIDLKKIQKAKEMLEAKIDNFEKIIQKFQSVAAISGPQDLTSIIWQLERNDELYQSRFKLDDKLRDLNSQKDALQVKLLFLKKNENPTINYEINPEVMIQNISDLKRKILNYSEACKKQESSYFSCQGIIQHLQSLLGIPENMLTKTSHQQILKLIGDKLISMKKDTRNGRSYSKTTKINTLKVPYSSKFIIDEIMTPSGPNALLNSPFLTPLPSPVSRIDMPIKQVKKGILKMPK